MNIKMSKSLPVQKVRLMPACADGTVEKTAGGNRARARIIPLYKTAVVRSRPGKVVAMFS